MSAVPNAQTSKLNLASMRERYANLSGVAQRVAQIYGVVYPHDPAYSRVAQWLAHADMRHEGRRITGDQVKLALQELHAAGIVVTPELGAGPIANSAWAPGLTITAQRSGRLDAIMAAQARDSWTRWGVSPKQQQMLLRCYTVAKRFSAIDELGTLPHGAWDFLAQAGAEPLLRTLPEPYLEAALLSCLDWIISNAANSAPVVALCKELAPNLGSLPGPIAFIEILKGNFEEAQAVFAELPSELQAQSQVRMERSATRAAIACICGDYNTAADELAQALTLAKESSRKRSVFPQSRAFTLAMLAVIKLDRPNQQLLIEQLVRSGTRQRLYPEIVLCVANAAGLNSENDVMLAWEHAQSGPFATVLYGFTCVWQGQFEPQRRQRQDLALQHYAEHCEQQGYRWLAAELRNVRAKLQIVQQHTAQQLQDPTALDPIEGLESDEASTSRAHEELGSVSLCNLITPLAQWEYPLQALEKLAATQRPGASGQQRREQTAKRLAWQLERKDDGSWTAMPREQRLNKSGAWSKGRVMALKRLHQEARTLEYLTDADRSAAAVIQVERNAWGEQASATYSIDAQALHALIGHPNVIGPNEESVEVALQDPELFIESEANDMLRARVSPHGSEHGEYLATLNPYSKLLVTKFSSSHQRLFEIIPAQGLNLPTEARQRLLDAVTALAGEIRIHSDVAINNSSAIEVPADSEPLVQLVPTDDGLSISLLVEPVSGSAAQFEPGSGGRTLYLRHDDTNVECTRDLEAELRQAAELQMRCPLLQTDADDQFHITLDGAGPCLELVEQLREAEARCLWPKGQSYKVVARADTSQFQLSIRSAAEWFSADGELPIDESRVLSLEQLLGLLDAAPDSRFLELGDGEFVALSDAFRKQLTELASSATPSKDKGVRIHPLAASALEDLIDQSQSDLDVAWLDQQQRLRDAKSYTATLPTTLKADLRPYQEEGFQWLARLSHWGVGACLADDMGLGKTLQTLALLLHRAADGPALVVAPTSVTGNWEAEIAKFAPSLRCIRYTGTMQGRASLLDELTDHDVCVVTYGLLQNDQEKFAARQWHTMVVDEAQAIKNAATHRSRAVRDMHANFRLATTGTPIENNLMDLHSLFAFLNPGLLGNTSQFRDRFALPIERDNDPDVRFRLRELISPFVLRRTKSEVLKDLPSRTEITLSVELSEPEAALYEALRRQALQTLAGAQDKANPGQRHFQVLAQLTKLRLACCHPKLVQEALPMESSKLNTFARTLDELLGNNHKVLVFSQFVTHLKLLREYLDGAGISYQYLDGQTRANQRTERIAKFQEGEGDVFLISLKAGGTGLNLTAADYVIHMDPWWNPAVEDQASDRAHRIGQTRPVTIYRLVTKGTIEEQIVDLHHRKRDLADRLLEGSDASARMDADALLQLLQEPILGG